MKSQSALLAAAVVLILCAVAATRVASAQSQDVLKAGTYSAKVKAIVCGGCAPAIEKTFQGMKEIDAVKVDRAKKTVQFTVKKDATVKVSDLQKALKAAADKMGMGADYTLSDLQAAK